MSRSLHPPPKILEVYIEALKGLSHIYCLDGLNSTLLSRSCVLEQGSQVGMVGGTYIPRPGKGAVQLEVNQRSCPLNDLLQPFTLYDWLLYCYMPPSSKMCPKQSARGFISTEVACLVALWLHQRQKPLPQNTQVKMIIPKISNNFFHQEPHNLNH